MNQFTVLSPAFYEHKIYCKTIIDSCEHLGINLQLYGLGEPYLGLRDAKVAQLIKNLDKLDTEYVMISDSNDVLFVRTANEILSRYHELRRPVIFAAEKQCFPQPLMADCYPKISTPWKYLNGGGYIGKKEDILAMLVAALKLKPHPSNLYRSRDWECDQFLFAQLLIEGYGITLDTSCSIFQCVGDITEDEYEKADPCLYHYNGHSKGIVEQYNKRFGEVYVA